MNPLPPRDALRLQHMLEYAREALQLSSNMTRADLDADRLKQLALTHLVQVIGEAANHISSATQKQIPLPWSAIVGTHNLFVHGYEMVDYDVLWHILTQELLPLIHAVKVVLEEVDVTEN